MCLRQAKAVSIEGHPTASYNGLYTHDSTHEGWPVLKNAMGGYCYRYTKSNSWFIRGEFTPDGGNCNAWIGAKEGLLPVGKHNWWRPDPNCPRGLTGSLTTTLLVRPKPLLSATSIARS